MSSGFPLGANLDSTAGDSRKSVEMVACAHCGAPSPPPRDERPAFCCQGCEGAYSLIHGWGLDDYYALRQRLARTPAQSVAADAESNQLLADLDAAGVVVQRTDDGYASVQLSVEGLHCAACAWLIERCPRLVDGWQAARVQMSDHTLRLIYDESRTAPVKIAKVLEQLGYRLAPLGNDDLEPDRYRQQDRGYLIRIAAAGFCAANAMWVAVALYAGESSGIATDHEQILRWGGALLGIAAVVGPGSIFFRGAWGAIKTRTPHMDLPLALGLGAGVGGSAVAAWTGHGDIYFDSLATLVFFLLLGRWVQFRQQRRALKSVSLLMRLTPPIARRLQGDGSVQTVPAHRLQSGDVVEVRAGDASPADGVVVRGDSLLNRSLLTGESEPVPVAEGEEIAAGTINLLRPLRVRVAAVGRDSRVGRLMQMVEEAANTRTPIVQLADRRGGIFVIVVMILALVTTAWWWSAGPAVAMQHAVALLIVACPCALALATPLSIAVALGRAAGRGILIRGGDVLERLQGIGTIWFDKTGTLTAGLMRCTTWDVSPELLAAAASIENHSTHPIAAALVEAARAQNLPLPEAHDIRQTSGGGIQGKVGKQSITLGTERFLRDQGIEIPFSVANQVQRLLRMRITPVLVAEGPLARGVLGVQDSLREDAADTLQQLRRAGWAIGILSGDHPTVVQQVGETLGLAPEMVHGGLSPEEKLAWIRRQQALGTTVMVGDGVNDAVALAAADVGVATRGGAEVSLRAAPVFLAADGLKSLVELCTASRRTLHTIRRGFTISLAYNALAVVLAMSGKISPLIAAILMPISSLTVVSLALACRTFSEPGGRST